MKLHAKELRIGNYYMYAGNEGIVYSKVKTIQLNQFGLLSDIDGTNYGICGPIPLTKEWLLILGFEKHEFDHKDNQYRFKDRLLVIRDGLFCDYGTSVVITTVHQLQNLYFALTGTELTLIK